MIQYRQDERLAYAEYYDFLKRTDLGSQYPAKNFEARVTKLLQNVDICVTARNPEGLLVGVCLGLTDWVYFLFLTDLGVDRDYLRQGIGKTLVDVTREVAGGQDDITTTTISNENAIEFYRSCGMVNQDDLVVQYCKDWENFVVS